MVGCRGAVVGVDVGVGVAVQLTMQYAFSAGILLVMGSSLCQLLCGTQKWRQPLSLQAEQMSNKHRHILETGTYSKLLPESTLYHHLCLQK